MYTFKNSSFLSISPFVHSPTFDPKLPQENNCSIAMLHFNTAVAFTTIRCLVNMSSTVRLRACNAKSAVENAAAIDTRKKRKWKMWYKMTRAGKSTAVFSSSRHFELHLPFLQFPTPVSLALSSCIKFQCDNGGRKFDIISLIAKKRDGLSLEDAEIEYLVNIVSRNTIDHVQIGE